MLPVMAERPGITIVGAGNLASALAPALHRAGYEIDGIVTRSGVASKARAKALARAVNSAVISPAQVKSRIVWLCVPDGEIARAARTLAAAIEWNGRVALHSSGALSSHELAVLRRRGAAAGSLHPLMTFVRGSRPSLAGVPFAVEGDARAARTARAIVRKLRGQAFSIGRQEKVAYHAWGMFASPLLTVLLAVTERVAGAAGVSARAARQRMLPILAQTMTNYAALGAPGTLSGPIARGDVDTVKKHLQVLAQVPAAREVYVALARASLCYLPAKNRTALEKLLKG
ncbi:MAG: Rossmann-like and DUF2520 domain-containing protein [Candidatus Sulfotelmatobacter sp.]